MKQLKLDAGNGKSIQVIHCCKDFFLSLPRQTEDRVDNHGNPPPVQLVYCLFKTGKRIAPSDILCRFFMHRLQSQLHPDRFDPVQLF